MCGLTCMYLSWGTLYGHHSLAQVTVVSSDAAILDKLGCAVTAGLRAVPAKIRASPTDEKHFFPEGVVGFNCHLSGECGILSITISQVGGGENIEKLS